MDELILTHEMIEEEISDFEIRIQEARNKLAALPVSASSYPERKRLNQKRGALHSEIEHLKRLVSYAMDALGEIGD